jgi:hypothetical protein
MREACSVRRILNRLRRDAKSLSLGEDALANLSIERVEGTGTIQGHVRIRSKTQGIALSLGDKITLGKWLWFAVTVHIVIPLYRSAKERCSRCFMITASPLILPLMQTARNAALRTRLGICNVEYARSFAIVFDQNRRLYNTDRDRQD